MKYFWTASIFNISPNFEFLWNNFIVKPEEENAGIVRYEGLAGWQDGLQLAPLVWQTGEGRQQPAVAELALVDVVPAGAVHVKARLLAQLARPQPGQSSGLPAVVERALSGGELLVLKQTSRPQVELLGNVDG